MISKQTLLETILIGAFALGIGNSIGYIAKNKDFQDLETRNEKTAVYTEAQKICSTLESIAGYTIFYGIRKAACDYIEK